MLSNHIRAAAATVAALGLALGLGGCSVGPVDLDDFLMSTSVADAQAAARAELAPVVTSDALRQADTLTVGILTTESAPLSLAASDGSQSGIDVDVAHALADALGLGTVSFVSVSDVDTALAESCDVVMGVTAENAGGATVVGSYVQSATGVFTKQGLDVPADASALSGARVAVQGGSVSESVLMGYELDVTEVNVDNLNAGFDALDAGGYRAIKTKVMAVAVPHHPGGAADLLEKLDDLDVDIEYFYCFSTTDDLAVLALKIADPASAAEAGWAIEKAGFHVFEQSEIE